MICICLYQVVLHPVKGTLGYLRPTRVIEEYGLTTKGWKLLADCVNINIHLRDPQG
jgi:hypothetical protein